MEEEDWKSLEQTYREYEERGEPIFVPVLDDQFAGEPVA